LAVVVGGLAVLPLALRVRAFQPATTDDPAVAVVDGEVMTRSALREVIGDQSFRVLTELYDTERRTLEQFIDSKLLQREAAARGMSVKELVQLEIQRRSLPVSGADARAVRDDSPERFPSQKGEYALARIRAELSSRRAEWAQRDLLRELRTASGVRILLEPPRANMDLSLSPSLGSQEARVTLVVFTDFSCAACAQLEETVAQLREAYPGVLRVAYRHFPLPGRSGSIGAVEAALCAGEQDRYWEMHRALFASQARLDTTSLERRAHELALEPNAFGACLGERRQRSRWQRDVADGQRFGVESTPTLLVNGRLLLWPPTVPVIRDLIDEELQASATPR
jgi:protein-disulfide isomerase